jgi:hypothetical protein
MRREVGKVAKDVEKRGLAERERDAGTFQLSTQLAEARRDPSATARVAKLQKELAERRKEDFFRRLRPNGPRPQTSSSLLKPGVTLDSVQPPYQYFLSDPNLGYVNPFGEIGLALDTDGPEQSVWAWLGTTAVPDPTKSASLTIVIGVVAAYSFHDEHGPFSFNPTHSDGWLGLRVIRQTPNPADPPHPIFVTVFDDTPIWLWRNDWNQEGGQSDSKSGLVFPFPVTIQIDDPQAIYGIAIVAGASASAPIGLDGGSAQANMIVDIPIFSWSN